MKNHILNKIIDNLKNNQIETDMESEFKPIDSNNDDVLELGDNIYKVSRLKEAMTKSINASLARRLYDQFTSFGININSSIFENWFAQGIDCKILNLGSQSWKKGKVKFQVSIEFYIEEDVEKTESEDSKITEPESPLDDLRRMIKEED